MDFNDYDICSDIVQEQLVELKALREGLVQTAETLDASVYYIWGEDMATYAEPDDYYLTYTNEGFRPFLVPYLVEDQSTVRGNIIVIAGGGYMMRCNLYEGYNIAEYYRDNGYNAFVLQRRIEPFSRTDAHLDLQTLHPLSALQRGGAGHRQDREHGGRGLFRRRHDHHRHHPRPLWRRFPGGV